MTLTTLLLTTSREDKAAKLTKGAALHEAIGECGEVPPASDHIPGEVKTVKRNGNKLCRENNDWYWARREARMTGSEVTSGQLF